MAAVTYTINFDQQKFWTPAILDWIAVGDWNLDPPATADSAAPPEGEFYAFFVKPTGTPDAVVRMYGKNDTVGDQQGAVAAWQDEEHWVALMRVGDTAELRMCDGGSPVTVYTSPANANQISQLDLRLDGDRATCTVWRVGVGTGNYPATRVRQTLPSAPPGRSHGLTSYDSTARIEGVDITVEEHFPVLCGQASTAREDDPVSSITLTPPPDLKRMDYLVAYVVSNTPEVPPTPVGWERIVHGTSSLNTVAITAFGTRWNPDRTIDWVFPNATPSPMLAIAAAYRRVDAQSPVVGATAQVGFLGEPPFGPVWKSIVGTNNAIVCAAGVGGSYPQEPKKLDRFFDVPDDDISYIWDDWTDSEDPITAFGWWTNAEDARGWFHPTPFPDLPEVYVTANVELRGAVPLTRQRSRGAIPRVRLAGTQRYIDAVLRDEPIAFWPLDEGTLDHDVNVSPYPSLTGGSAFHAGATYSSYPGTIKNMVGLSAGGTSVVAMQDNAALGAGQTIGNYTDADDFTIELWVRRTTYVTARAMGYRWDEANVTFVAFSGWSLSASAVGTTFSYFSSGLRGDIPFGAIVGVGEDAHLVVTYTAGEGTRVFLDGAQQGSVVANDDTSYIRPRQPQGVTNQFVPTPGEFEVVGSGEPGFYAIYQQALTPEEVVRHYRAGVGPTLGTIRALGQLNPLVIPYRPTLGSTHGEAHQLRVVTAPSINPPLALAHSNQTALGIDELSYYPDLLTPRSAAHSDLLSFTLGLGVIPTYPSNPAPLGSARFPIGGLPSSDIDSVSDEDGNVLVDENGDVLIFD